MTNHKKSKCLYKQYDMFRLIKKIQSRQTDEVLITEVPDEFNSFFTSAETLARRPTGGLLKRNCDKQIKLLTPN